MRRALGSTTSLLALTTVICAIPSATLAQSRATEPPPVTYEDETARRLHEAAMAERERFDDSIVRYTAVVRQRVGAALRMPMKDRTLYRSESSHRLWWNRDAENLIQVLAFREQTPVGVNREDIDVGRFDVAFDPMNDRLLFGAVSRDEDLGDPSADDFWFEHPLYPEWVDSYRFISGDTLTVSLPDGRQVRAIELQVIPHVADVHRMTGALWIEPETGSLVRAVYRLSDTFDAFRDIPELQEEEDEDLSMIPGIFKPWTAEVSMIAVDYALWEFEVWLPRSVRMDGIVSAGILKAPMTFDLSYEMEAVATEASLAEPRQDLPEVHFRTRSEAMAYLNELAFGEEVPYEVHASNSSENGRQRVLMPRDQAFLGTSPELPPPIWDEAPGFASEAELRTMFDDLADLPTAPLPQLPATLRWGLQRPDLLRSNRVEGLSLGARGQIRPRTFLGPLSMTGTGRLGIADWEPNVRGDITRETLRRKITLSGYNELTEIDEGARHLGLGNSLLSAAFGRDDGDYFYRSGGGIEWTPPSADRLSYRLRAYAEYHRPARVEHSFAVTQAFDGAWAFRPNVVADEGWEYGGSVELSPWWGTDPRLAQGGIDLMVQGGTGRTDYARASLLGRLVFPLPSDFRVALEAGAGTSWGMPSVQRLWYLGGPRTLRGYTPRAATGGSFGRGRAELARSLTFGSVSVFTDLGWAGDRADIDLATGLFSVGAGLSIVDGLIRFDVARGFRDPKNFRVDFYLDAIL